MTSLNADFSDVHRRMTALNAASGNFMSLSLNYGFETVFKPAVLKILQLKRITYRGGLANSLAYKPLSVAPTQVIAEMGAYTPYAADIELGTGPHSSSEALSKYRAILEWVMTKKEPGVTSERAQQVTFFILRHFQRAGTRANPYLMPAFLADQTQLADAIFRDYYRRLERYSHSI